jgi:hypothetical protein
MRVGLDSAKKTKAQHLQREHEAMAATARRWKNSRSSCSRLLAK